MAFIRRVFVEKKKGFDVEAAQLAADLRQNLPMESSTGLRIVNCYDIEGMGDHDYARCKTTILSEPPVDHVYEETFPMADDDFVFAVKYLPGQYDQRADSAMQCIQAVTEGERPPVEASRYYVISGALTEAEKKAIKEYCINPVDSMECPLHKPESLQMKMALPEDIKSFEGFTEKDDDAIEVMRHELGLAMSVEDFIFCRDYFRDTEKRNPTVTEIRAIDTYWSDHCRHTTFLTKIENISFAEGPYRELLQDAYNSYLAERKNVYGERESQKDICLMDIAVMGMKALRQKGLLADLDESEEINACSIVVDIDADGQTEPWLIMFKNETHNHPTEIEPFGGAATCLGGAIRDPLSGRSYVYQAMRVTGSGNPLAKVSDTMPGKLPQRKITQGAAAGYSSYGNQIGLATGLVQEIYDEGYTAKRMEIGAVVGAAPKAHVRRERPVAGDVVILTGGRTGRDGCGGATGSSKEHTEDSILTCGAEVQKGNPPEERKLQRLFRNPAASRLIKRCNDFGAGGVSVAIGELADGLVINLDAMPKKYEGLDGTELAISESQERMAVVVAQADAEAFIQLATEENLEAVVVAHVTDNRRLQMLWRGQSIVDISRDFLDTNGATQTTTVQVKTDFTPDQDQPVFAGEDLQASWLANLQDLNVAAQKGLVEHFDSTVGAGTVLMPFGGQYQLTPSEAMAAKVPVPSGETDTATVMTFGYNPAIAKQSPFHGAALAVIESVSKSVAAGGAYDRVRLTFQEYFERLGNDPLRWGKPMAALLGAFQAQIKLGIPAIGGKDSMSGSFKDLDVPPTLVSFALNTAKASQMISNEFKAAGNILVKLATPYGEDGLPCFQALISHYKTLHKLIQEKVVLSAQTIGFGGIAAALSKMAFGNALGFNVHCDENELFVPQYGSFVLEVKGGEDEIRQAFADTNYTILGQTTVENTFTVNGTAIDGHKALLAWLAPLEKVFPTRLFVQRPAVDYHLPLYDKGRRAPAPVKIAKPRVFIPVFPGTNCEDDMARQFIKAGAIAEPFVIRNLTTAMLVDSIDAMVKQIDNSQIIAFPGGFSAGDEPEGSGKFIAAIFRSPALKDAVMRLLTQRDGLIIGICNGFQALVKLGLLPYGEIRDMTDGSPTLTFNTIGRHISHVTHTKVVSNLSPWFANVSAGDMHHIAVSHSEGRFIADEATIRQLAQNGQVATQYVDFGGNPTDDIMYNPNGSAFAIEGITSPDGRILGKMGHSERIGNNLYINVPGPKDQQLFAAGVGYFS